MPTKREITETLRLIRGEVDQLDDEAISLKDEISDLVRKVESLAEDAEAHQEQSTTTLRHIDDLLVNLDNDDEEDDEDEDEADCMNCGDAFTISTMVRSDHSGHLYCDACWDDQDTKDWDANQPAAAQPRTIVQAVQGLAAAGPDETEPEVHDPFKSTT